jgi:SAM-dependent methyltransferase
MDCEVFKYNLPKSSSLLSNFKDSMRRHFVDDFFQRKCAGISKSASILDLGGTKSAKRGLFNINEITDKVIYLNYSSNYSPDILGDACLLPLAGNSFDYVICSELLEHVSHPDQVLAEIYRILRPGGQALITVPFMFPVHPDPIDVGRYTDYFWKVILEKRGFQTVKIEWQGGYWCVLVDMFRGLLIEKMENYSGVRAKIVHWCFTHCQRWIKIKAVQWDATASSETFFVKGCTTGFGICCFKSQVRS